ncbi:MAG: hypothetical protein ACRD0P_37090, partial [Stackebrandtia sp.]
TYTGDDPWGFAITRNNVTRDATPNEIAFVGAHIPPRGTGPVGRDPHHFITPTRARLATLLGTSRHSIDRARKVVTNGVDGLEDTVLRYGVPIQTAARISELPTDEQHDFVAKVFGGMSPMRAAGLRLNTTAPTVKRPKNQHTMNGDRYRYIQREGIAATRDGLAVLQHLFNSTEGLSPDIEPAEAAQWLNDLGRERRNLNRLMNLLKERTQ